MKGKFFIGNVIFIVIITVIMFGAVLNLITNIIYLMVLAILVVSFGMVGTKYNDKVDIITSIILFVIISILISIKLVS